MSAYPPQGLPQIVEEETITTDDSNFIEPEISEPPLSFNEFYDISSKSFKNMMDISSKNQIISSNDIKYIEQSTRGQSSSNAWFHHRMYKVTSSSFYSASRNTVKPTNKLRSMYYQNFENNSTRHGIINENHVLKLYNNFLSSQGINVTNSQVGMVSRGVSGPPQRNQVLPSLPI